MKRSNMRNLGLSSWLSHNKKKGGCIMGRQIVILAKHLKKLLAKAKVFRLFIQT